MDYNNNKKAKMVQSKQKIEQAKLEWTSIAETLAQEKSDLGYKDSPWDDFMALTHESTFDEIQWSQILALQAAYNEHKQLQKLIWAEDIVVAELNAIHAIVRIDQTYVLTEAPNHSGGKDFSLESRQSFKAYYEDENVMCADGKERNKADIWLKSPKRNKYKGIIFDPTSTEYNDNYYNLWKGFARIPQQGDCSKYWEHIKDNICNGDLELYTYIRKWLAYVFQRPHEVHTALVLQGSQGTGKNSFVEPLGVLMGSHYAPLSSITELVSNFNYHLKNAVLIHANEALWGGNKKELGTVKAMITEKMCLIEGKGKDRRVVRNFKHVILSSNEDWPVHLDPDDRRFLVIRVSEKHKEDHIYFQAIQEELSNKGYEALLYDLLNEDISNFNPRRMPSSVDSFHIKMRSAESPHRYIYEALNEGGFSIAESSENSNPVWQESVPKSSIYDDYCKWCEKNGENKESKELFGRVIKKVIFTVLDSRPSKGGRTRCYKFPSLRKAQEEFCQTFKEKPERIFDDFETIFGPE